LTRTEESCSILVPSICPKTTEPIQKYYNLGPNALPLISSWKVEKLTYWLVVITIVLAVLTVISIVKLA
jgi:hypothetical protein